MLFLHGRHYTCYTPDSQDVTGNWPCHPDELPVPSHLGYVYAQRLLATQGYVTVSISANGINGQDWRADDGGAAARSVLVRRHLRAWARWAAAGGAPAGLAGIAGQTDLDRVLLVGHSRGGEGVDRAAIDTMAGDPWDIDGQVLIGATAFGRQEAPYVPTVVLLPYCDGDVIDLQGQAYVDVGRDVLPDPALRSSVLAMGANHNYFNTEWTPGISAAPSFDDWFDQDDPVCGRRHERRLTAKEQRAVGRSYVAGAARLLLRGDERLLPMYDGARVQVPSVGDADVRTHALGARRHVVRPGPHAQAVAAGGAEARLCIGRSDARAPRLCGRKLPSIRTPHWPAAYFGEVVPVDAALEFGWESAGARGGLLLDAPVSLGASTALDARVVSDPAGAAVRLDVRIEDASGDSVVLTPIRRGRLLPLPGRGPLGKLWAQTLRVRLPDEPGIDMSKIRRIDLIGRSDAGHVWMLDIAGVRPGLRPVPDRHAARVDFGTVSVPEGDGEGPGTLNLPVTVHGTLTRAAQLSVQVVDFSAEQLPPPYVLTLQPGQQQAVVPISYQRDDRDDYDVIEYAVVAFPLRGAMTGDYLGTGRVLDDDPTPLARLRRVERAVAEGDRAQWRIVLAEPVDYWVDYRLRAVRTQDGRAQLRTDDVPAAWLRRHGVDPPADPVSLARAGLVLFEAIPAGRRSVSISVPVVSDGREEPTEVLALEIRPGRTVPQAQSAAVLVRDATAP